MAVRVLQLVHGFPPRERAGTEIYAARLAAELRRRGHAVLSVATAPAPGAPMWARTDGPDLVRIVNNAPYAGLRSGASDPHLDRLLLGIEADFRPDVVHVQHLAFASSTTRFRAPVVWTLHDAWAWCPAGGLLLRDGAPCPGPNPACAGCASRWAKDSPRQLQALKLAGALGKFVSPTHLQRVWTALPPRVRRLTDGAPAPVEARHIAERAANVAAFAGSCAAIVSPSRWLANEARAQGLAVTDVIPHGVAPGEGGGHDGPFVFVGTLAWHKGPDLVLAAWRLAATNHALEIYGRPGPDPTYAVVNQGALDERAVAGVLRRARALVMGSRWPENAPLIVLEARAAGCPVIAPAIGGIPEIVEEGRDGWLYPPGDVAALADRMRSAATATLTVRPPRSFAAHTVDLLGVYGRARQYTEPR